jgi:hypothetical protein
MKKNLVALFVFFTILALFIAYLLFFGRPISYENKMQNGIILLYSIFNMVATFFLILNYFVLKDGYLKNLEPALWLCAINETNLQTHTNTGRTIIHYENPTKNPFKDLNIGCEIEVSNQIFNYSHLFTRKMYMGPTDKRDRRFNFIQDLQAKGCNIIQTTQGGIEARLKMSFSYTFNKKFIIEKVQEYRFDHNINGWEIV